MFNVLCKYIVRICVMTGVQCLNSLQGKYKDLVICGQNDPEKSSTQHLSSIPNI